MKLYNISGVIGNDETDFAGLYLLNEDLIEIYYVDDKDFNDKYLFRDLDFLKTLGKKVFDVIKKYNIDEVIVLKDVKIECEFYDLDFNTKFIEEIKKEIKWKRV